MKNQISVSTVSLIFILFIGMTQHVVGQGLYYDITIAEKEAINSIIIFGPSDRFIVNDLEALKDARKGIKKVTISGSPPGTELIIFKESKEKGGYSVNSNVALLSPGTRGFESKIPNFSNLPKGSVVRFLGNVVLDTCKLEACTFYGEFNDPLSFIWLPDKGLVYLGGKGFVKLTDSTNVMLPRPSKIIKENNNKKYQRKVKHP